MEPSRTPTANMLTDEIFATFHVAVDFLSPSREVNIFGKMSVNIKHQNLLGFFSFLIINAILRDHFAKRVNALGCFVKPDCS